MQVYSTCQTCRKTQEWNYAKVERPESCACGAPRLPHATDKFLAESILNQCPICGCPHVYRQKDFNRNLGVALIVVGVLLSYWTYGISLVVVTLVDWSLWRFVKELGVCYKCESQFRSSETIQRLEPFNLSLHDYYKNLINGSIGPREDL